MVATLRKGITRRSAMGGMLGTAAFAAAARGAAQGSPKKPNFLYIMADDMGYADLSCYGRPDYQTPAIDRLAAQGIRFTHAYANSAVCTATRVALITGRYQYRLPIGLQEPLGRADIGLPPEHPTIASLLRDAGYRTSLIGKWHMGRLPKYGPLKSGYDEFWGIRGGGVDYFRHGFGGNLDLWDGTTKVHEAGYMTDLLADRTITTLERRKADGRPFLISLHFTAPHWPWEGPDARGKAESQRQNDGNPATPRTSFDNGDMETYAAMVRSLDSNVGRILTRLSELGLDRDTVVVFTSDNGGERFSDTWPFTGMKTELLEGGIRIPAIVRWPGVTKAGSESAEPFMSMDWLPTFVAAAGARQAPAYPSDGVDIAPALRGGALPERTLFWRFGNKGQQAARRGEWKYLKIRDETFLFNVVDDPLERANWKDRDPARYNALRSAFEAWDKTMLHDAAAEKSSYGFTGRQLADHFGIDS